MRSEWLSVLKERESSQFLALNWGITLVWIVEMPEILTELLRLETLSVAARRERDAKVFKSFLTTELLSATEERLTLQREEAWDDQVILIDGAREQATWTAG